MKIQPTVYEGCVLPEWIDYNGHMNDACYVNVFSKAIDAFMDYIGLDESFRSQQQLSIYTLQSVVHYLQEVGEGEPLQVVAHVLEHDSKKIRLFLTMQHASSHSRLSTMETLLLHVDMSVRRAAAFRPETLDKLETLANQQRDLGWPAEAGHGVSLQKRR
ncbi:thioesterase family protein [Pseudomonas sp. LFM046]|uniref:thioesterase family protein n=1 Tax=Pseudomonas sp. LFM046 TaxID=1608357 RepID=UPI0005CFAFEE|nr:thioesterase family protein [Pseudomonas sp. LFM046]